MRGPNELLWQLSAMIEELGGMMSEKQKANSDKMWAVVRELYSGSDTDEVGYAHALAVALRFMVTVKEKNDRRTHQRIEGSRQRRDAFPHPL